MFGEFNGLPIHALVLHLAVVVVPTAALVGVAMLVPKWRRFLRWPFVALTALAAVIVYVTKESGENLKSALGGQLDGTVVGDVITKHQMLGDRLFIAVLVLLALAVVVAVALPRLGSTGWAGWARWALTGIVTVAGAFVIVLTIQTGEAGAKAVWNPADSVDYSAK